MSAFLPTLKQLQYLVAVQEHGHFGKAAEACFVTQSTLSSGIRELEMLLGIILIERRRKMERFTPIGHKVAAKAHRILREAEELKDMAKSASKPLADELHMSVIPTIAPFMLPHLLPQMRARFPDLKLFLREETSALACQALHHGDVDCVLLALPFECGDVASELLFEDALYVAFPFDDPRNPPEQIAPDLIDEGKLLLLTDGHCLKDHALAACNRPELRANARMMGSSLYTLIQMVDNDLGLTLIPKMAVDAGLLHGTRVQARPLAAKSASRQIGLIWRRSSARGEEFALLANTLREIWANVGA